LTPSRLPAVLAAYNWAPNTDRYRKLSQFVDAFFTKFPIFQNPPFHPKWKEVSLSAPLAGWQRFPASQLWLDQHGIQPVARDRFEEFLRQAPAGCKSAIGSEKEALFKQFQAWEAEKTQGRKRKVQAQVPVRPAKPEKKDRWKD